MENGTPIRKHPKYDLVFFSLAQNSADAHPFKSGLGGGVTPGLWFHVPCYGKKQHKWNLTFSPHPSPLSVVGISLSFEFPQQQQKRLDARRSRDSARRITTLWGCPSSTGSASGFIEGLWCCLAGPGTCRPFCFHVPRRPKNLIFTDLRYLQLMNLLEKPKP